MASGNQDRRVRRTRKLLRDTLVETMQEKELQKITVRELCIHADINRSTFYLHFRDVYDLWACVEQEVLDDMNAILVEFPPISILTHPLPLLLKITESLEEEVSFNRKLFRSKESIILLDKLKTSFIDYFIRNNRELIRKKDMGDFELYITFVMSGAFSLFYKWFMEETDVSLKKLAHVVEQLIVGGVDDFLAKIHFKESGSS